MAIENSVSNDFLIYIFDSINVFDCRLSGVYLLPAPRHTVMKMIRVMAIASKWRKICMFLFSTAIVLLGVVMLYHLEISRDAQKVRVLNTDDIPKMTYSARPVQTFMSQLPTNLLHSYRFDIIVKIIYAYFFSKNGIVPEIIQDAYTEHIRAWNLYKEGEKQNNADFINAFHKTIDSIKENGFVSEYGAIPVNKSGFPFHGAHRIAAAVALSKNVTVKLVKRRAGQPRRWGYSFFLSRGFRIDLADMVMMQWMTIQQQLPIGNKMVFILSLFSNKAGFRDEMYQIVKDKCSLDKGILYEKAIKVNKLGMEQLDRHVYGNQNWIGAKIQRMVSKVINSTLEIRFIFFFGRPLADLNECEFQIRQLYNEDDFTSAVQITGSAKDSLILAEMILNPNSVEFLNYGKMTEIVS